MKLRILSDLHLDYHVSKFGMEHWLSLLPEVECDAVVVAGDIAEAPTLPVAVELLKQRFFNRKLILLPGNHDYWKDRRGTENFLFEDEQMDILFPDVTMEQGQKIVSVTGWHIGPPCRADDHMIANAASWIPKHATLDLHTLLNNLPADVVVTHHLPHENSVPERFKAQDNHAFVNPLLTELVEKGPNNGGCKLWVHGHTHDSCDYTLPNGTRVVCNPVGHHGHEMNPNFNPALVVEV